jgi:glucose-1-phosphate cytidylyltransferase
MKVVLLAGGLGTRISEETNLIPKPMVTIGDLPILLHIMKRYSSFGFSDFTIALGYKGYVIKEFFNNYQLHTSDVSFDFSSGNRKFSESKTENWNVDLIDTGENTMTGGRLLRLREHLSSTFMLTYGDGLSDVNLGELLEFHKSHGKLATVTAVSPPGRYGALDLENSSVKRFKEKPDGDGERINGGFFVFEPEVLSYLSSDADHLETTALPALAKDNELQAFIHDGFWQPMDTLRERNLLEQIWASGEAPWSK